MRAPTLPSLQTTPEGIWVGRSDSTEPGDTRRLFQVVRQTAIGADGMAASAPVLIGYACDAGVSRNQGRAGAAQGPTVLRKVIANLPAHHITALFDAGDVTCHDNQLEAAQETLAQVVHHQLNQGGMPIVLGGGHDVAWGTWQGLVRHLEQTNDKRDVLIINLDAHLDLRSTQPGNSGTPFCQIATACQQTGRAFHYHCLGVSRLGNTAALFGHAEALGVRWVEDINLQERHLPVILDQLNALIQSFAHVYLTIDLDVLPAAVMPAVSAPAACGVPFPVIEAIVMAIHQTGKVRAADLAEFNPTFDRDNAGARSAARLAYRLLGTPCHV